MKTIIAGSRTLGDIETIDYLVGELPWVITEVVSGGAKGVDRYGEIWGESEHIPVKVYPAEWDKYGKSAGFIRNLEMADYADCLLAIWDGGSKGTKHMIEAMKKRNKPVYVQIINGE